MHTDPQCMRSASPAPISNAILSLSHTMTTDETPRVRLATVGDAARIAELVNTAFSNDHTTQVFLSADHDAVDITSHTAVAAKIAQPDCAVLVATEGDGAIVAHCSVTRLDDGARAWFGLLAVAVRCQRRGLGSRMLAEAERYALREWRSPRMEFDVVNTRAELIAWYRKHGYEATGRTIPFPYEHHANWEGLLRDDLHFVVFGKALS